MVPIVLQNSGRSAFVVVESLLALAIIVLAVIVESDAIHQHYIRMEEVRRVLIQRMLEKESALSEWQQVVNEKKQEEHHDERN
ncbi:hypothetical protein [Fructobacillus sp. CRL 2054]|uniref:hypothetical protein n=1 Tax=Fructobacillus sp. CRL 2054 TaxID=2763007 RepID=UPI002377F39B|nr:hypothetical protein [Fructobacillus sp. CRL 2054]